MIDHKRSVVQITLGCILPPVHADRTDDPRRDFSRWASAADVYEGAPRGALLDVSVRALHEICSAGRAMCANSFGYARSTHAARLDTNRKNET